MTNFSKTAALKATANMFTPVSGGVMHPYDESNPDGPYTVTHCADDEAVALARTMRVTAALELMGYSYDYAEYAAERASEWGGEARNVLSAAIRKLQHQQFPI